MDFYSTASGLKFSGKRSAVEHYVSTGDSLRISPHPLFDVFYYHDEYRDVERNGITALFHYIENGEREGRQPHPLFDPNFAKSQLSAPVKNVLEAYLHSKPGHLNPHPTFDEDYVIEQLNLAKEDLTTTILEAFLKKTGPEFNPSRKFDSSTYRAMYPGIKDLNAFYHFSRWGRVEGKVAVEVSGSSAACSAQIESAAKLDSDIIPPYTDIHNLSRIYPLSASSGSLELYRALRRGLAGTEFSHIFFLPSLGIGGAERVAINIASSISRIDREAIIAFVQTDRDDHSALKWLSPGAQFRVVCISNELQRIARHIQSQVLANFLQTSKPKHVFIANSGQAWDMLEAHGKSLSPLCPFHAFAFCYDFDSFGRRAGYAWTHLRHCINYLTSVITDNHISTEILIRDLSVDPENQPKFMTLYQPAPLMPASSIKSQRKSLHPLSAIRARPTVLWAGRFSHQKDLPLALQISLLCPNMKFIFAGGARNDQLLIDKTVPSNAVFVGPYGDFSQLEIQDAVIFLYTAAWDGLPNVLLEAGVAGLKIVSRATGGIPSLINQNTGWLVPKDATPALFAEAIEVAAEAGNDKVDNLQYLLRTRHSLQAFDKLVYQLNNKNSDLSSNESCI